ncbi:MAG: lipoate---protein ligase [Gaiellales bacterium]|nr:lipoate---protein ligase [Gaiellales bacterium]
MSVERATAAELLARADDWLERTRADGELRAGWSRPTDAVIVIGSAQRLAAPGAALRRSTGGGAVSCDDHYLMLDVVLPRGHPLVIEDVGRSYRWLAEALLAALAAHGAELRAVTPREAAAQPPPERAAARLACFAGTGTYELVTVAGDCKLVGLAQRRRGGAALLQAGAYVAAPRLDVAASLGLQRDQEARLRARLARVATLDDVAPGFADAPPPAAELVP